MAGDRLERSGEPDELRGFCIHAGVGFGRDQGQTAHAGGARAGKKRGGGDCWTYTHAWMNVHRDTWSHVSVLASIDKPEDAVEARKQGYAPAIVVSEFSSPKAFTLPGSDVKYIPCPAQTSPGGKEIGCTECRLCFNADRLYENNFGIAFEAHGVRKNNVKRRLQLINV